MEHPEAKCTSQNPLPKSDTNQTPQRFAPLHSKVKTMTIYEILNTFNILMVGQAGRPLLRFCRPRLRMNIIQPCPSPMATSPYQRIALYTYKEIVFTLLPLPLCIKCTAQNPLPKIKHQSNTTALRAIAQKTYDCQSAFANAMTST